MWALSQPNPAFPTGGVEGSMRVSAAGYYALADLAGHYPTCGDGEPLYPRVRAYVRGGHPQTRHLAIPVTVVGFNKSHRVLLANSDHEIFGALKARDIFRHADSIRSGRKPEIWSGAIPVNKVRGDSEDEYSI